MQLPNFLIIGAQKAGTTSLYYYCKQHPQIFMSSIKEPMFFNSKQAPPFTKENTSLEKPYSCFTLSEYAELFKDVKEPMRGEASTAYLANPSCALWIRKIIPDTKIIAILRNPVERAYSSHKMYYKNNIEKKPFEEAILYELENGTESIKQGQHYLKLGLFGSQIKMFRHHFPKEQVFIADYEEYNKDTVQFLKRIFSFLEVGEFIPQDLRRYHVYSSPKEALTIDNSIKERMINYFEKDVQDLQAMVDFDVLKWLRAA